MRMLINMRNEQKQRYFISKCLFMQRLRTVTLKQSFESHIHSLFFSLSHSQSPEPI